jgi:hypothetical protein
MGGSQLVPRLWERALRRTVSAPGGPRLFKIAQAISGLVSRELDRNAGRFSLVDDERGWGARESSFQSNAPRKRGRRADSGRLSSGRGRITGDPARNDALASIDWCARHKGREYCHGEQERTNGGERPKSRADKP